MTEHKNLETIRLYDKWKKSGMKIRFKDFVASEGMSKEVFDNLKDIFGGKK